MNKSQLNNTYYSKYYHGHIPSICVVGILLASDLNVILKVVIGRVRDRISFRFGNTLHSDISMKEQTCNRIA